MTLSPRLTGLLTGGLLLIALVQVSVFPQTGDVAWLTTAAERLLDGQELYSDIREVNPPMSIWLYVPAVALARLLALAPDRVVGLSTLLLAVGSLALSLRLARGLIAERWLAPVWVVGLVFVAIVPAVAFAQREHYAMLAMMPMLAAIAADSTGRREKLWQTLLVGVLGGIGMAIKPHLALAFLLPSLVMAWRGRSFAPILAPRNFVAGTVLLGYVAIVALLVPSFAEHNLPLAVDTYLPPSASAIRLLLREHVLVAVLSTVVVVMVNRDQLRTAWLQVLLAAGLGFFLAYLLPGKSFPYHMLPFIMLMGAAAMLSILRLVEAEKRSTQRLAVAAIAAISLGPPLGDSWFASRSPWTLYELLRAEGQVPSIAIASGYLNEASPLHRMLGAELVNRGPHPWVTTWALNQRASTADPERRDHLWALAQQDLDAFYDELTRTPPQVLLVGSRHIDWHGWMTSDPRVATFLGGYRELAVVDYDGDPVTVWWKKAAGEP